MSVKTILINAKALITDPAKWGQGSYVSEDGQRICASEALRLANAIAGFADHVWSPAYSALFKEMNAEDSSTGTVCGWNDKHTHAEVLAAFDRAIEAAE